MECKKLNLSTLDSCKTLFPNFLDEIRNLLISFDFKFIEREFRGGKKGGGKDLEEPNIMVCPSDPTSEDNIVAVLTIVQNHLETNLKNKQLDEINVLDVITLLKLGMTAKFLVRIIPPSVVNIMRKSNFTINIYNHNGELVKEIKQVTPVTIFEEFQLFCTDKNVNKMRIKNRGAYLDLIKQSVADENYFDINIVYKGVEDIEGASVFLNEDVLPTLEDDRYDTYDAITGIKLDVMILLVQDFEKFLEMNEKEKTGGKKKQRAKAFSR